MSVPVARRNVGKLTVLLKAEELATYTMVVVSNEKNFPKRYRWCSGFEIINLAKSILRNLIRANNINVGKDELLLKRRNRFQDEALEDSVVLLTEIDLAYRLTRRIGGDKVEYWTGLIHELQNIIRGWKESDKDHWKDEQQKS